MARSGILVAAMGLLALSLAGCTLGTMEAVSLMGTDKTVGDHVISLASGKDCSSVRKEQGKTYCKEDEMRPPRAQMHCYRNIGQVTCYEKPLPYGNYQPVDINEHNIPPERR